jgi:hypothetical protein
VSGEDKDTQKTFTLSDFEITEAISLVEDISEILDIIHVEIATIKRNIKIIREDIEFIKGKDGNVKPLPDDYMHG